MHVSLPAVPEQIQVARRIVRKELVGLGWPEAKIAACEDIAAQLAGHAIGLGGVSGYYLGVTKRTGPGPESAVAVRVSVTVLDAPVECEAAFEVVSDAGPGTGPESGPGAGRENRPGTGSASIPSQAGPADLADDGRSPAEVLTKQCGVEVNIAAQSGSWAAWVTLPAEVPCLSAQP